MFIRYKNSILLLNYIPKFLESDINSAEMAGMMTEVDKELIDLQQNCSYMYIFQYTKKISTNTENIEIFLSVFKLCILAFAISSRNDFRNM